MMLSEVDNFSSHLKDKNSLAAALVLKTGLICEVLIATSEFISFGSYF